ncbi:MAG: hypothetical protein M3384_10205 [Acidobacteriota bacterium]|nr:hypothetical protein [Acidobacteriota bacterium]
MKTEQKIKVTNDSSSFLTLWLEPWGEDYGMFPNEEFEIIAAEAEDKFCFHIFYAENGIQAYAEGDAKYVAVRQDGKLLSCGHNRQEKV